MTSHSPHHAAGSETAIGFEQHDHDICIESALQAAENYCEKESLRFTPVRRKVLELLLHQHRALGAYAILDLLGQAGFGSQPPVAYRALDFLRQHGFVHKIERLNAFVACAHPGQKHTPAFMICRLCDAVSEAHTTTADGTLDAAARASGFQIERMVVEAEGVCPTCAEKA